MEDFIKFCYYYCMNVLISWLFIMHVKKAKCLGGGGGGGDFHLVVRSSFAFKTENCNEVSVSFQFPVYDTCCIFVSLLTAVSCEADGRLEHRLSQRTVTCNKPSFDRKHVIFVSLLTAVSCEADGRLEHWLSQRTVTCNKPSFDQKHVIFCTDQRSWWHHFLDSASEWISATPSFRVQEKG